jgi:ankyrin repeat protein
MQFVLNSKLWYCAALGNLESVQHLVEGGANIEETDFLGMTALSKASCNGHFEIVVYLVERGANVAHTDGEGFTVLHGACGDGGNLRTVKYLLEKGASITKRDSYIGMTALLHAADEVNLEVVQYLLSSEGGASITETDEGNTAGGRYTHRVLPSVSPMASRAWRCPDHRHK